MLECIGTGGMGTVYRARQYDPVSRFLAVKFVREDRANPEMSNRFRDERSQLAAIEHNGIARMYQAGRLENDGEPYFVMEFVDGKPITDSCKELELELDLRQRLEMVVQICGAVQCLHN